MPRPRWPSSARDRSRSRSTARPLSAALPRRIRSTAGGPPTCGSVRGPRRCSSSCRRDDRRRPGARRERGGLARGTLSAPPERDRLADPRGPRVAEARPQPRSGRQTMLTSSCRAARRSPGRSRFPKSGTPTADGDFLHEGAPVRDLALTSDLEGQPTLLELGALRLCLIDRGGRLAIRTWDTQSPARAEFDGIDHWPLDPAMAGKCASRADARPDDRGPGRLRHHRVGGVARRSRLRGRREDRIGSRRCRAATLVSCG